MMFKEVS